MRRISFRYGWIIQVWLDHYVDVFGEKSVFVFDNGSSDEYTLDILRSCQEKIGLVMRYSNMGRDHNIIHNTKIFGDLYHAIKGKCRYFALFDADELLVYFDGRSVSKGKQLKDKLIELASLNQFESAIFCNWLMASRGSHTEFLVPHDIKKLFTGVRNGKHFVPSARLGEIYISHNHACPSELGGYFSSQSLWLLHFQQSDVVRRIRINYEKIRSRNLFVEGVDISKVMSKPSVDMLVHDRNINANSYIRQICALVESLECGDAKKKVGKDVGIIKINDDKSVEYSDWESEKVLSEYVSGFYSSQEYRFFKSGLGKNLPRTTMFDLGVFGRVESDDGDRISGWVFDLAVDSPPSLGFFVNGFIFHTIRMADAFECFVEDGEICGGFEITKKFLIEKAERLGLNPKSAECFEVIHLRTMIPLIGGGD